MPRLPTECPSCGSHLQVTRLSCGRCETQLEGHYALPPLLRLSEEDLGFVLAFVRASGSLKEMARLRGQSYPTIRNHLNRIIEALNAPEGDLEARRQAILDAIAKGELTVAEAAEKLRELGS